MPGNSPLTYVSPQFPKRRHGFELTELLVLARQCELTIVSLRTPVAAEWEWLERSGGGPLRRRVVVITRTACILGLLRHPRALLSRPWWALLRDAVRHGAWKGLTSALSARVLSAGARQGLRGQRVERLHADFASLPATVAMLWAHDCGAAFSFCGHAFDVFSTVPAGAATGAFLRRKLAAAETAFAANSLVAERLAALSRGRAAPIVLKRNGVRAIGGAFPEQCGRARPPTVPAERFGVGRRFGPRPAMHRSSTPTSPTESGRTVLVFLGELVPKKGVAVLLEALQSLGRPERFDVRIHGAGALERSLRDRAARDGLPVRFEGPYAHDQLAAIFADAAALVVPSVPLGNGDSDGVPTVILEAAAHGVPAVASAVGAIADFITDGVTGLLVRSGDAAALAAALERLAADPEGARALGARARTRVFTSFRAETEAPKILERFSQVPPSHSPPKEVSA